MVRRLGKTADDLADAVDKDQPELLAKPSKEKPKGSYFSGAGI